MRLTWRAARRNEVPVVVALLVDDILGQGREVQDMERYFAAFDAMAQEGNNRVIVGVDATGEILATYQLTFVTGLSLAAARRAQVESVRVAARRRGQGLGQQMFADVEARARAAGCSLIQLTMNASRADSRRFYQALGFEPSHVGFKKSL